LEGSWALPVSFRQLLDALEFADMNGFGKNRALLCRQTGKVFLYSEAGDLNELPEDADDQEKYIEVPNKKELDLGKRLRLKFARECLPDDYDEVRDIFSRRGAYRNFRILVERRRVLQAWYDFEAKETEHALRAWCQVNDIELAE
jgi:hypothetical protein